MAATQRPFPPQNSNGLGGIPGMSGVPGGSTLMGELKSEVAGEAAPLLTFVLKHIKLIVSIILLAIAVIIGYGVWQWHTDKTLREAHMELGRILVGSDNTAKIAALKSFAARAPESLRGGIMLEIATAAMQNDDLQTAADAYGQVFQADPQGAMGLVAALNQADLLLQLNKPQEALTTLNAVQAPEYMKSTIQAQQALALEVAGQISAAITKYEALLSMATQEQDINFYRHKIAALKATAAKATTSN